MIITDISSCVLPDGDALARDLPGSVEELGEDFVAKYDSKTLFYDVFYYRDGPLKKVIAIGPTLRKTLRVFLKSAEITIDGLPVQMIETSPNKRFCQLEFEVPTTTPRVLSIRHEQFNADIPINLPSLRDFAGTRAITTLSKNNRLNWIEDWARHHIDAHGANSLVFFDNGSDAYDLTELRECIAGIKGLKASVVLRPEFTYGPSGNHRQATNARYLQFAMFAISKMRFLADADAVLNVDVDEMVYSKSGASIFDAVKEDTKGYITLPGTWRHATRMGDDDAPLSHADHTHEHLGQGDQIWPKWCVDMKGAITNEPWRTHGFNGITENFHDDFGFFHCRQITTNWHFSRPHLNADELRLDPFAQAVLAG
ncbi:MAG: hypothetical protein P8Q99_09010 [Paracoccaceae bacterium]|nr:hypothetical protein [Paracoccaceae bacterium]